MPLIKKNHHRLVLQVICTSFINYWVLLPKRICNIFIFPFTILTRRRNRQLHAAKKLPFILNLVYPPIIFLCNLIDLLGLPEQMDVIFSLVKPNSRRLTETECQISHQVFGTEFPCNRVVIDEDSWFAKKGATYAGYPNIGMGLVLFRSINFNRELACDKTSDAAWLIHELTHVKQMQTIGSAYIFESLIAQHYLGYNLPNLTSNPNVRLNQLNIEQQAEVSKYYFLDENKENICLKNLNQEVRKGQFN